MDPVLAFFTLLCIFGALIGAVLWPFRKRRALGKWLFFFGVVGIVASFIVYVLREDDVAKGAGFLDAADQHVAKEYGYRDAYEWARVRERFAQRKAEAAAEAAHKREEVAAAKARVEAEAAAQAAIAARDKFIGASLMIDFPAFAAETGCDSRYSEDKKADKFNRLKDKSVSVDGVVAHVDGNKLGIKLLKQTLTYDVLVTFSDSKDIYDLEKGEYVTVAFIMRRAGGCFLPYTGDSGVIVPSDWRPHRQKRPPTGEAG